MRIERLRRFVMNARCPVYIVDDDTLLRQYLVKALRAQNFAPTPFSTGADFIDAVDFLASGIVLLELDLTGMSGLTVQENLLSRRLDISIIAMTTSADIPTAVNAIKRGAADFLEKPFADDLLLKMLVNVQRQLKERADIQERKDNAEAHLRSLTQREMDIMLAICSSQRSRDVADELHLSIRTVEMHRARIMKKFGARKFSEIMRELYDAGFF